MTRKATPGPISKGDNELRVWNGECLSWRCEARDSTPSGTYFPGPRCGRQRPAHRPGKRPGDPAGIAAPDSGRVAGPRGRASGTGAGCSDLRRDFRAPGNAADFIGHPGDRIPLWAGGRGCRGVSQRRHREAGVFDARLSRLAATSGANREEHDARRFPNGYGRRRRTGPRDRRRRTRKNGRTASRRSGWKLRLPEMRGETAARGRATMQSESVPEVRHDDDKGVAGKGAGADMMNRNRAEAQMGRRAPGALRNARGFPAWAGAASGGEPAGSWGGGPGWRETRLLLVDAWRAVSERRVTVMCG